MRTNWANWSILCNFYWDHQAKCKNNDNEEPIATNLANDKGQEKDHDKGIKKNKAKEFSFSLVAKDQWSFTSCFFLLST